MTCNIDKAIAKTILTLGLSFYLLTIPTLASAAIIFSQGFNPSSFGATGASDFDTNPISNTGIPATSQRADDFNIQTDNVLDSISWQGIYVGANTTPAADNFTLRIFTGNGTNTAPTLTPFWSENLVNTVSRTVNAINVNGQNFDLYTYDATLFAGASLTAGTTYWLSIVNDTSNNPLNNWQWAASSTSGSAANRAIDSDTWVAGNGTFQFQLTAVPVPGAIWFLASGLLGLVFSNRNQKRLA